MRMLKSRRVMVALRFFMCVCAGWVVGAEPSAIKGSMVDVLTLGVKNDGSEDVSEIVNKATEKHILYFPPGIYKVAKPIYLENSIVGGGYARTQQYHGGTWLKSTIENSDGSIGVLNLSGKRRLNIENLNIALASAECGIRLAGCTQRNMLFFDKIGIHNIRGYGIYVRGEGSRPIFMDNITLLGAVGFPELSVGIMIRGTADNRISNVEIMGCRVGMHLVGGFNYASNVHIWTGCLPQKDNGTWWRGTRSIVLENKSSLHGTNIYPDTSFYGIEAKGPDCVANLSNVFYYEDGSTNGSPDFDGELFHGGADFKSTFNVFGGEICLKDRGKKNGRMRSVYMPGTGIRNVLLRSNYPICKENLRLLVLDDTLPDYAVNYAQKGLCKIGDIVAETNYGFVEADIAMDDGAVYTMRFYQKKGSAYHVEFSAANPLALGQPPFEIRQKNDSAYSIYYVKTTEEAEQLRFMTRSMTPTFRPIHHGILRSTAKRSRCHEVLKQ